MIHSTQWLRLLLCPSLLLKVLQMASLGVMISVGWQPVTAYLSVWVRYVTINTEGSIKPSARTSDFDVIMLYGSSFDCCCCNSLTITFFVFFYVLNKSSVHLLSLLV